MKIVIVNGSPRRGNTYTALNAIVEGAAKKHEIEILEADKLDISPCKGCNACQCHKGCVAADDSNKIVDKLVAADMIIFGTPVYWWGMTAQLKTLIDKCYCKGLFLKGKRIGVIVCGGSPLDNEQYELIRRQFACMSQFLTWRIEFFHSYYVNAKDELAGRSEDMEELVRLGASLS